MEHRRLGNSGLLVSALSLGTVALGLPYGIGPRRMDGLQPPQRAEATRLVHRALEAGINFVDTARGYGQAEELLGHALQGRRTEVVLATKIGCYDADGAMLHGPALRRHMHDSLAESLRLLRTDWIDVLMLHSAPVELLAAGEALDVLQGMKAAGLARAIGVSTYGEEAPQLAIDAGVDALQVAYNVLDQRLADNILPLAQSRGVGVVVRSVYLKGALTPRADDLPERLAPLRERSDQIRRFAQALEPAQRRVEVALRFVLSNPSVTSALVGVRSSEELATALAAAAAEPLTPAVLRALEGLRWNEPSLLDPSGWYLP